MPKLRIDPKIFINKPYTECPKCHKMNYGILMVSGNSYTKKCVDCKYTEKYPLPVLNRKIIYLDQFVISNMMKAIHASLGKTNKVDPFYLKLFEKLDRLNKLQLIVCPDSPIQDEESRVSKNYKDIKRMFEQLSHGCSFYHADTIRRFQVIECFKNWLGLEAHTLTAYDVIQGGEGIDGWDSRLIISIDFNMDETEVQNIRDEKKALSRNMMDVINSWKNSGKSFEDFYSVEIDSFGPMILKKYAKDLELYDNAMISGDINSSAYLGAVLSENSVLMTNIHSELTAQGCSDEDVFIKTAQFLNSENIKSIPYAKISCILYACMATAFATGRKKLPSPGFFYDVDMLAAYAPYCDAMFVDKECRRFLTSKKAITKYDLSGKLYSLDNKEDFLKFLDEIESKASSDHIDLVRKVYGDSWPEPYYSMYD